jgi:FkbM family methyltransferase
VVQFGNRFQRRELAQRSSMRRLLQAVVRRMRPAPVGAFIATLAGLSRREVLATLHGTFWINPVNHLGSLLQGGEYEPSMRRVLERYLRPGGVFIDLGANEGYFSVVASRIVGAAGVVVAVEPQSRLQPVIAKNISLNAAQNVRLVRVALSQDGGPVLLRLTHEMNSGATGVFQSTRYPQRTESVSGQTLPGLLADEGLQGCDLMKVDVEGAEYAIFMGDPATAVLCAGTVKCIALEYHDRQLAANGFSGRTLHEHILRCGYELDASCQNWVYVFAGHPPP